MNYSVEKQKGKVKVTFDLTAGEWEKAINDAYQKTKHKYALSGFRKGKVPRKVIENMYGPSVFLEDAFNGMFPNVYSEFLEKEPDIYPVAQPDVDFEDISEKGIRFSAVVVTKPEVTLGDYKGLECKLIEAKVTDKDVTEEIKKAQERSARKVNIEDRPTKKGDFVIIDYSGSVDGNKFEGGTAEKQELELGSGSFIPGFEEQVEGMKLNDEKDITVKFPKDYHAKDLADKDAVFAVKLHEIKEKQLPELDDEFAKDVSSFNTFAEYKDDVKKNLLDTRKKKADADMENELIDKISEKAKVEIPEEMVNTQLDYMLRDFEYRLMYQGMKLDDYFKYSGSSVEDFKKDRKADAEKTVKTRLVIEAIVKAEDLKVEDAELDAKLKEMADKAKKTYEEYIKTVDPREKDYIKNDILMEKFVAFLKANNKFAKKEKAKA